VIGRAASKYLAFARVARRLASRERAEIYGRVAFFGVILAVFSSLWRAVAESGMPVRTDSEALVWYLMVTEWIVLAAPPLFASMEEEVKRGDIAYRLPRPVSYLGAVLAEGAGQLVLRVPVLGAAGCSFAWLFTGRFPAAELLWVLPLVGVASFALMTFYVILGLSAFWVGDVAPCYWVFQKLLFVLGGLMLPLELYPAPLLDVAALTPFPRLLYGPGAVVLGSAEIATVTAWLLFWLVLALAGAALMFRSARRRLELNGG